MPTFSASRMFARTCLPRTRRGHTKCLMQGKPQRLSHTRLGGQMSKLKHLLNPKILFPAIMVIAVIAALLAFGNIQKVIGLMERFDRSYLLWFFLLMIGYTIVRGIQWHFLLHELETKAPIRSQIFAFLVGEMTKSLPIGNYVQNYVLQRTQDEDFGRTSSASTLIILTEVAISVLGVDIIGLGDWGWLRPVITIGTVIAAMGAWVIIDSHEEGQPPKWIRDHKSFMKALGEVRQFQQGVGVLMKPRTILIESGLSAAYLMLAAGALYVVLLGLHITNIDYFTTLSVYFFSLAVSLMIPLPIDFGAVEVSGTGAFIAVGLAKYAAVGAMLINRVLSLLSAFVIALIGMIVMHDELHAVLTRKPHDKAKPSMKHEESNLEDADHEQRTPEEHLPHPNGNQTHRVPARSGGQEQRLTEIRPAERNGGANPPSPRPDRGTPTSEHPDRQQAAESRT